jgi:hypothetical protein
VLVIVEDLNRAASRGNESSSQHLAFVKRDAGPWTATWEWVRRSARSKRSRCCRRCCTSCSCCRRGWSKRCCRR